MAKITKIDIGYGEFASVQDFYASMERVLREQDVRNIDEHLRLLRSSETGMASELERWPTVFTMPMYGELGLQSLYAVASDLDNCYPGSAPAEAILAIALGDSDKLLNRLAILSRNQGKEVFDSIAAKLIDCCDNSELKSLASRLFNDLILGYLHNESGRNILALMLMETSGSKSGRLMSSIIFSAIAKGSLAITDTICDEFEGLITQDAIESTYQTFLEKYPSIIDPLASEVIKRQPLADKWKTDFVIRRLDNEYILVELERPRDAPMTAYPAPSRRLAHALGQVINWLTWLEDNIDYAQRNGFDAIQSPLAVIVIGRNRDMSKAQRRALDALNTMVGPRVRIDTYDDVLRRARDVLRNLTAPQGIT